MTIHIAQNNSGWFFDIIGPMGCEVESKGHFTTKDDAQFAAALIILTKYWGAK